MSVAIDSRLAFARIMAKRPAPLSAIPAMALAMMAGTACVPAFEPLPVVDSVDPARYVGKWYEIAKYPNAFQTDCVGVTAEYALQSDGTISVLNTCVEGTLDGPVRDIAGTARIVDSETNAKLKVSFFPPFEGDYWILELDDDYQYAVVGAPSRQFLWILSRTPTLDDATFERILEGLPALGYDPERLERTPQEVDEP